MMSRHIISLLLMLLTIPAMALAEDEPTINPTLSVVSSPEEGMSTDPTSSYQRSAPATLKFEAHAENTAGWTATYEWHFFRENDTTAYLVRYDEDTEYTFTESGNHRIQLWATFTKGDEKVSYDAQYYREGAEELSVTISESQLEFPNAFSPNGDDINDVFKAMKGYKSIVEFQATIFNRWGQKLYTWTDPAGGWDGTFNGKAVKDGVYFVLVKAKGADGRKFNIKKDVNLLREYIESSTTTNY